MKCHVLVIPGLESVAKKEIERLCSTTVEKTTSLLSFETDEISLFARHTQTARRFIATIDIKSSIEELEITSFTELFSKHSFKVEVENVKGQENRFAIAKQILEKIENPKVDVKNPEFYLNVFHTDNKYFMGIDLCGKELNTREFRVFPHSASFKGDISFYLTKKVGFEPGKNLLVGFAKDGSIAIEAALLNEGKQVTREPCTFETLKLFQSNPKALTSHENTIYAFDETTQNTTAMRKNAKIAEVSMDVKKYSLEELDIKYDKEFFDCIIFHITTKDEHKLNEIYYQVKFLLKPGGKLLFVSRENWEPSIPEYLSHETETFQKGGSVHKLHLMTRK